MNDNAIISLIITGAKEALAMVAEWITSGQRPSPKRVAEVWSHLEQARAKLDTDAAARARWGDDP